MKIIIAPNAFEGSLSAHSAAIAMQQGVERAIARDDVDITNAYRRWG